MWRAIRLGACLAVCAAAVSCASEALLAQSGPTPAWFSGVPQPADGRLLFTGRAVGVNVLDEANMRNRAMDDARQQMASQIATAVEAQSLETISERGSAAAGTDTRQDEYTRQVRTLAAERLLGVSQVAYYWERWQEDPGLFRRAFIRYKYAVLAAYPREEYDRALSRYVRLITDRERARALIEVGRPKEAADLLEKLLTDYPEAAVSIRLGLAEAYAGAQMFDRAAETLRPALDLGPDAADEARIRERIERYDDAFPDLSGASAVVLAEVAGQEVDPETVKAWVEEAAVLSNLKVYVSAVRAGGPRAAAPPGAGSRPTWVIELDVRELPGEEHIAPYGVKLVKARVECNARAASPDGARTLAAVSFAVAGTGQTRAAALRAAAEGAVRKALRGCMLQLAAAR